MTAEGTLLRVVPCRAKPEAQHPRPCIHLILGEGAPLRAGGYPMTWSLPMCNLLEVSPLD